MKKLCLLLLLLTTTACSTRAPITPGTIPIPQPVSAEDEQYGHQVLGVLTKQHPLETNDQMINKVRDIVDELAIAANADQHPWHVYVLREDEMVNAAATRGNHLFVWTGLMKKVRNESELTTVIAHEFGHLLAEHPKPTPAEMSAETMTGVAGEVARQVVIRQGSIGALAGIAQVLVEQTLRAALINPESQRMELEADLIGMHLMAEAGQDPRKAVDFWKHAQGSEYFSNNGATFLSTHPSSQDRLENLEFHLQGAIDRYNRVKRGIKTPRAAQIGRIDRTAPATPQFQAQQKLSPPSKTSIIQSQQATVFSEPSSASKPITTLKQGQSVATATLKNGWLKITSPVQGYIRNINLGY